MSSVVLNTESQTDKYSALCFFVNRVSITPVSWAEGHWLLTFGPVIESNRFLVMNGGACPVCQGTGALCAPDYLPLFW